ncbi:hypothetical protein GQR58_002972 [Nymphon striatum]|nr:hypothetical protein GQR58_002972 [Nymphon striatum]
MQKDPPCKQNGFGPKQFQKLNSKIQSSENKFSATIHNSNLPVVTKFTHLQSLLTVSAKRAIDGLSLTTDNCEIACGFLKTRFRKKDNTAFVHIQGLLALGSGKGTNLSNLENFKILMRERSLETLDIKGNRIRHAPVSFCFESITEAVDTTFFPDLSPIKPHASTPKEDCNKTSSQSDVVLRSHEHFVPTGTISLFKDSHSKPIKILRATGASQSLLLADILSLSVDPLFTDESVLIQNVECGIISVPIYCVNLKSDLVNGTVKVSVLSSLPVNGIHLLLGNDLAGDKVVVNPIVTKVPDLKSEILPLQEENENLSQPNNSYSLSEEQFIFDQEHNLDILPLIIKNVPDDEKATDPISRNPLNSNMEYAFNNSIDTPGRRKNKQLFHINTTSNSVDVISSVLPFTELNCDTCDNQPIYKIEIGVHHSHYLQNSDILKNIDSKFQHKSSLIQKELYSTLLQYSALFLDIPTQTSEISCDRHLNIQEDSDIFKLIEVKSSFEETIFSGTKLSLCDSDFNYKDLLLLKYIPAEIVRLPDLTFCILFTFIFELLLLSTRHVKKFWTKQMCVVANILSLIIDMWFSFQVYLFLLSTECVLLSLLLL